MHVLKTVTVDSEISSGLSIGNLHHDEYSGMCQETQWNSGVESRLTIGLSASLGLEREHGVCP